MELDSSFEGMMGKVVTEVSHAHAVLVPLAREIIHRQDAWSGKATLTLCWVCRFAGVCSLAHCESLRVLANQENGWMLNALKRSEV